MKSNKLQSILNKHNKNEKKKVARTTFVIQKQTHISIEVNQLLQSIWVLHLYQNENSLSLIIFFFHDNTVYHFKMWYVLLQALSCVRVKNKICRNEKTKDKERNEGTHINKLIMNG